MQYFSFSETVVLQHINVNLAFSIHRVHLLHTEASTPRSLEKSCRS